MAYLLIAPHGWAWSDTLEGARERLSEIRLERTQRRMKESHRYRTPTAKGFEDPSENFGYAIFEADRDTTTVGDNYRIKSENPIRLVEAVGEFRKAFQ